MLTRSPANGSPVYDAWAVYDEAALTLCELYRYTAEAGDTPDLKRQRLLLSEQAMRLWADWRDLFLASEGMRSAA